MNPSFDLELYAQAGTSDEQNRKIPAPYTDAPHDWQDERYIAEWSYRAGWRG